MLKRKIDETTFNGLSDILKAEYTKNGNEYVLDTDDARDLTAARDFEKRAKEELKKERDAIKTELDNMKAAGGDWQTLEASYKQKIADKDAEIAAVNTTLTGERKDRYIGAAAMEIASKNFTTPKLMVKEIAARLDLDKDGKTVIVVGADGKKSASSLEDLTKEFVDNADYKSIVLVNKASGSAGNGLKTGSASDQNSPFTFKTDDGKAKDLSTMSNAELAAYGEAKRAETANGTT